MPDTLTTPKPLKWIATAPTDDLRRSREAAVRGLADDLHLDLAPAAKLAEEAATALSALSIEDARWLEILRTQRDLAHLTRGLSGRGAALYQRAAIAWDSAANEITSKLGGTPGSDLAIAIRRQLSDPLGAA